MAEPRVLTHFPRALMMVVVMLSAKPSFALSHLSVDGTRVAGLTTVGGNIQTVPDYVIRNGKQRPYPIQFRHKEVSDLLFGPHSDSILITTLNNIAPLVRLHSEDPFRPSDIAQHVRHTTPMLQMSSIAGLPELNLDNLALLNDRSDGSEKVALTAIDDPISLPAWFLGETPDEAGILHNATACVVILVASQESSSDLDAFYFYFYSFNRGPNITQVLSPIRGLIEDGLQDGMNFGDHVGDWEYNMVRFHEGRPTGIYFSQHSDGSAYDWDDPALSKDNGRALVYSAYGSHANYISVGDHVHDSVLSDYCDAGHVWDPVSSAYFYIFDPVDSQLTQTFPSDSSEESNFTSFVYFSGLWGDLQYPDDDSRQNTVPYFGLKRFVSGPTGPITKHLVRKGLFPDHREKKSWLQWGVGIFMSLYPCCLRGWRAWVSGTTVILMLIMIVLAIRYAAKQSQLKVRGYKKIEDAEDIPLNDMDHRENSRT